MEIKLPKLKCKKCGWTWTPRKPRVVVCPNCNKYTWNDEPNVKEVVDGGETRTID